MMSFIFTTTRPKDNSKRRVILDLSYSTGASVNDAITRDKFDGLEFTLTFPTIHNFFDKIRNTRGKVLLKIWGFQIWPKMGLKLLF